MKAKEMKKQSSFKRLVKSPVRFLIMARDAYIRSMTSCSAGFMRGGGGSGGGFGLPTGNYQIYEAPSTMLPRSFTMNDSNTTTGASDRCRYVSRGGGGGGGEITAGAMRRPLDLRRNYSCVVMMGRIDEEKACEVFEEEEMLFDHSKKRKINPFFTTQ